MIKVKILVYRNLLNLSEDILVILKLFKNVSINNFNTKPIANRAILDIILVIPIFCNVFILLSDIINNAIIIITISIYSI